MAKGLKRFSLAALALFFLSGFTQGSALFNRGMMNVGLVYLADAISCDSGMSELARARSLLGSVERRSPSALTRLHLATAQFLWGDRQSALSLLSQAKSYPLGRSPLVSEDRFEYYLIQARTHMRSGTWPSAIEDFHKAMVLEPDRILPVDDHELYIALAEQQKQIAAANPSDPRTKLLLGKYLMQVEAWTEGLDLIQNALIDDNAGQLSITELATAEVYQARALRATGDMAGAQAALKQAISLSPNFRQSYIDLLDLLQETESGSNTQDVERRLAALGPTFRLGQFGSAYVLDEPTVLPNGWKLIGYEVDEQLLEWATAVDLVLWWQAPATAQPGKDFLRVDGYWLQRQTVRNLFPNSGFEWGVDERGVPLGHDREYYAAPKGSLGVETSERNGVPTQVLWAQNSAQVQYVALISTSFVVDANAYYLMAGWLRDEDQLARIGRLCVEQRLGPDLIYYIASPEGGRPTDDWLHVANLASAIPGGSPIYCETFVSNNNSRGKSSWDNVLLARLPVP